MTSFPIDAHSKFYDWQLEALEKEWLSYANQAMNKLWKEKKIFIGRIWGVQEKQGNVILRFKTGNSPRIKNQYLLSLAGQDLSTKPADWEFSYKEFRASTNPRLSGLNTEIKTLFFLKSEDETWSYMAVSNFSESLIAEIQTKYLSKKAHPLIILAKTDPPIDYLLNLKKFINTQASNQILNIDIHNKEEDWHPENVDNELDVSPTIIETILKHPITLIQGPPGTGKSYLAAQICSHFLSKNQKVCLTALTNKALSEVSIKKPLEKNLRDGRIYKTNLSLDEKKNIPGVKTTQDLDVQNGQLLLTTYFMLSKKYPFAGTNNVYDFLIIEEASQAFLATIALFTSIANRVLIIGDHKQLKPVALDIPVFKKKFPNVDHIIEGLPTLTFNGQYPSFRLTKTRRLSPASTQLTAKFYSNKLFSLNADLTEIPNLNSKFHQLFHEKGGVTKVLLPISQLRFPEEKTISILCQIASELLKENSQNEIAILSPYVKIESKVYEMFSKTSSVSKRLTISTIHKIQGLTCDYTLLFLPLVNPSFDLNPNLFNVATSRAKKGSLIVTYSTVSMIQSIPRELRDFLSHCKDVSEEFKVLFKDSKPC